MAVRNANCTMPLPSSPVRTRRALGAVGNVMSTPPPNRALSAQLKLKGSLTDPAQPRRREAFGAVPMLSNNAPRGSTSMNINLNHDTSLDLFNIHEHDYEYDSDLNNEDHYDESFSLDLQNHTSNVFGYSSVGRNENKSALNQSNTFADPFFDPPSAYGNHVLNTIPESVEHQFHASQPQFSLSFPSPATSTFYTSGEPVFGHYLAKPSFVALPPPGMHAPIPQMPLGHPQYLTPTSTTSFLPSPVISVKSDIEPAAPLPPITPTDCSVCLASYPSSLAVLQPCAHPLCSACLTSALNIVGEKDMQCAVCNNKVADFKLVTVKKPASDGHLKTDQPASLPRSPQPTFNTFTESTASQFGQSQDLDSAFEFGFDPSDIRASTPKLEHQSGRQGLKQNAVLRIDNVPWDITPRQITAWLQQPVERVYVLLDNKGKTLSHAYVEVKDPAVAGAILRGETSRPNAFGRKERGSVLGRGKRARGVTVTRSTQEELMTNLFPSWRGTFEGPNPSLVRLEGDLISRAIEVGLLTDSEINSLRHLIQSPDSHFLKVPVLPFHSLVTLLCKFPPDIDSRVFWSASTRDKLFDLTCVGLRELIPRVEKARQGSNADQEHTMELVHELAKAAVNCQVFTGEQVRRLSDLLTQRGIPVPPTERSFDGRPESSGTSTDQAPSPNMLQTPIDKEDVLRSKDGETRPAASFEDLAKEFGVEANLVQALAHRLAGLS
ncbi:hypothetical protein EST38_g6393 [Candolleomyces aberdarensis]|uniref:RING-type domain-containing protein n=1 Tax=Candolleomyces aberdarensis TaxID=2316362 RepID=A0A4Q2DHS9_9AGAR|nr:hypothetical protein EST38_g6393 [Candolleomyces aberdarensis]